MRTQLKQIGPYEIIEEIGTGGMATVYKAYQPRLDRYVAIKMMHKMFLEDANFLARFEREARIVARLDHPHIVPIYDYNEYEGLPYLVMKYIEGQTLKHHVQDEPLNVVEIKHVMQSVCDALGYAHQQGVLHRDIKPSNILIDTQGNPYLTDFGLARIAQQGESTLSIDMMVGTPHYISPEQAQDSGELSAATDIYSTGVVLYEMMAGRLPFTGSSAFGIIHKHINAAPPYPSQLNPEIPDAVDLVLLKALEKDPARRYASASDLYTAFQDALDATNLYALDASRVQRAAQLSAMISMQTPGGRRYTSVTRSVDGRKLVQVPILPPDYQPPDRNISQWIDLLVQRVRQMILSLRQQLHERGLSERFQESLDEINHSTHQAVGAARQFHPPGAPPPAERIQAAAPPPVIESGELGTDENLIRRRAHKRINMRRGFYAHLAIFLIVIIALAAGQGELSAEISGWLQSDGFVTDVGITDPANIDVAALRNTLSPLADLPFWLLLAAIWGSGLASHGLKVFDATNRRRIEARRNQIDADMTEFYGPEWAYIADTRSYRRVRKDIEKRASDRVGLMSHALSVVLLSIAGFLIIPQVQSIVVNAYNIANPAESFPVDLGNWASIFISLLFVSLLIHAIVYLITGLGSSQTGERAIQREMARERELSRRYTKAQRKNTAADNTAPAIRLSEDGEMTDSFLDEISNKR
jgi:serine/threonine protein kinase